MVLFAVFYMWLCFAVKITKDSNGNIKTNFKLDDLLKKGKYHNMDDSEDAPDFIRDKHLGEP